MGAAVAGPIAANPFSAGVVQPVFNFDKPKAVQLYP